MIFLDTSFLFPLFNVEDEDHLRVRPVFESHRGERLNELLVTTPRGEIEVGVLGAHDRVVAAQLEDGAAEALGDLRGHSDILTRARRTTVTPDPGLEATRAVREKISREHGNDARRLVEHYIEHQRRFADRLRWAPGTRPDPKDAPPSE